MDLPHQMREAWQLQDHLDELVLELDEVSKWQDKWSDEEENAIDQWELILDEFSEQLQEEYDAGDRSGAWPSKDRLDSLCRRASGDNRTAWRQLRKSTKELTKYNRRAANIKQIIGGLQSELKTLGEEVRAPRPAREPEGHVYGGITR